MDSLVTGAWISLQEGCEITSDAGGRDATVLTLRGAGQQSFELHCQAEALRQLVEAGARALAEMDALAAKKQTSRVQDVICA